MASTSAGNGSPSIRVASPTSESAFSAHSIHSGPTSAPLTLSSAAHKKVVTDPRKSERLALYIVLSSCLEGDAHRIMLAWLAFSVGPSRP